MNASEEMPLELGDDAINQMRKLFEKWNDRITLDNLRLVERYLECEIEVLLHFLANDRAGNSAQLCAVIRNGAGEWHLKSKASGVCCAGRQGDGSALIDISDSQQEMMLIADVELMKVQQLSGIRSIRLRGLDETYRSRMDSLYFSHVFKFAFGRTLINRKSRILGDCVLVGQNQMARQVIQGTSEIVDRIAGKEGKFNWKAAERQNFVDRLSESFGSFSIVNR